MTITEMIQKEYGPEVALELKAIIRTYYEVNRSDESMTPRQIMNNVEQEVGGSAVIYANLYIEKIMR